MNLIDLRKNLRLRIKKKTITKATMLKGCVSFEAEKRLLLTAVLTIFVFLAAGTTVAAEAPELIIAESDEEDMVYNPKSSGSVSVHDPMIIKEDGTYYLFGSHLAQAKSDDLIDWNSWPVVFIFKIL